ncbi:RMP1 (YLR145W) [Zygosaccharomyces parabailii]|uniref:ZYBA0S03-12332g1_1 n=1 Tax=Zygosaccharomyces bailii (strain CLIB 213 / ATCC 58445 / CBS 680 / BCRC 21525 / NBRC 1098 / NCYC 1416 / NRRL Y-2227) TaxID=1333698 RepID=A0A8J2T5Z4_ZYGB2|nr:RMP1 (YLR145W) [Zygosaccharomyces parabailii]CDF89232.1 ZYBA0S03-12332g1_1 [Zygosaccharomyces bailii CLIB 213]CDH16327.1 uncharacterized protein ZBAI_08115 [Zygosaccharomyces bailii ISA1307]SJM87909.1 uncharacterized protein ZBIST_4098 [Zygosaccharomyces bailii]
MNSRQMEPFIAEHKNEYLRLSQESRILHLIYHRNKNQHQSTHWWKRLNMLKRNCSQVVNLLAQRKITIRSDLAKLYHLLHGFRQKQAPRTYYDFNSVIGLGQFVSLGVVLVGILARIYTIYGILLEIYDEQFQKAGFFRVIGQKNTDTKDEQEQLMKFVVEEDFGEEITQITMMEQAPAPTELESVSKKRSKAKGLKKKKKSAIDSIFG